MAECTPSQADALQLTVGVHRLQDKAQVACIDGDVRLLLHNRFRAKRNTERCQLEHVQIIRTVAHCNRAIQRDAMERCEFDKCDRLCCAIDYVTFDPSGEPAINNLETIGSNVICTHGLPNRVRDHVKAARDQRNHMSALVQGGAELDRTMRQADRRPHFVEHAFRQALEKGDSCAQGSDEVEFSAHRCFGDCPHLGLDAGMRGDEFDDFLLDNGAVDVHHHKHGTIAEGHGRQASESEYRIRTRINFAPW